MRLTRLALFLAALATATVATAQTIPSYPYPSAGTPPSVQLQCSDTYAACLPITTTNPLPTRAAVGGNSLATAQVSVGTTSTLVAAARPGRSRVMFHLGAANNCVFGNNGVTLANGFRIAAVAGTILTIDTSAPVYSTCDVTTTVAVLEQF